MNKCNYCDKDFKFEVTFFDQGKLTNIFFCEDHAKKIIPKKSPSKVENDIQQKEKIVSNLPNKQIDLLREDKNNTILELDENKSENDCVVDGDNLTDDHLKEIEGRFRSASKIELKKQLDIAIQNQDYKRAAELRDQLQEFEREENPDNG